jgi:hypothetical protein
LQSPSLWKLYVLFTLRDDTSHGNVAAKSIFLRGLRCLPWCKPYIMLAFTTRLRLLLNFEELRNVYRVLVEKELRLHVDLEEVLDEIDNERQLEDGGDESE